MAKQFTCTRCGEEFGAPNWTCKDGVQHSVEGKTYYTNAKGLNGPITAVQLDPRGAYQGKRKYFKFQDGMCFTTDPEVQDYLENSGQVHLLTEAEWDNVMLTEKQKLEKERRQHRSTTRDLQTSSALVDKLKAQLAEAKKK